MDNQNNLADYPFFPVFRGLSFILLCLIIEETGVVAWHWFSKICFYIILGCIIVHTIYHAWNFFSPFLGLIFILCLIIYSIGIYLNWNFYVCCIILGCLFITLIYHAWNSSPRFSVKVHVLVSGETFRIHETFMQKLNLQIKHCSAESSSVILVFCPVVSRIGTDMEAAMARVTEDKPVILVFMHHSHNTSHMTNTTVQPSRSNIVQVVHCAFQENAGLLQCKENNQAVSEVRGMLQKYQQGKRPSTEEIFKSV